MVYKDLEKKKAMQARHRAKPENKEYQRAYREANKEKAKEYLKEWQKQNPDKNFAYQLKCLYGVPLGGYDQFLEDQKGLCACCGTSEPGGRGRFHIDHDHPAQKVRGLICFACNTGIGKLGDSVEGLERAIAYLKRANSGTLPES